MPTVNQNLTHDTVAERLNGPVFTSDNLRFPSSLGKTGEAHFMSFAIYDSKGTNLSTANQNLDKASLDYERIKKANELSGGRKGTLPSFEDAAYNTGNLVNGMFDGAVGFYKDALNIFSRNNPAVGREADGISRQMTGLTGLTERIARPFIFLFIPDQVKATYATDYSLQDYSTVEVFNQLSKAILAGPNGVSAASDEIGRSIAAANTPAAIDKFTKGILGQDANLQSYINSASRTILNPHLEFSFKSVAQRKFDYTFIFSPSSEEEAISVQQIIRTFKAYSMPTSTAGGKFYKFPAEFEITFHSADGQENMYLHRHGRVVLEKIEIDYTPDSQYSVFRQSATGNSPTKTKLVLHFAEVNTITRKEVLENNY